MCGQRGFRQGAVGSVVEIQSARIVQVEMLIRVNLIIIVVVVVVRIAIAVTAVGVIIPFEGIVAEVLVQAEV